jgi:hypothetical protein
MLGPEPQGAIAEGPLPMSMSTQPGPVKAAQKVQGPRVFCSPIRTAAGTDGSAGVHPASIPARSSVPALLCEKRSEQ